MKKDSLTLEDLLAAARLLKVGKPQKQETLPQMDFSDLSDETRKELYFPFKRPPTQLSGVS